MSQSFVRLGLIVVLKFSRCQLESRITKISAIGVNINNLLYLFLYLPKKKLLVFPEISFKYRRKRGKDLQQKLNVW